MVAKTFSWIRMVSLTEILLGIFACLSIVVIVIPKTWFDYSFELDPGDYTSIIANDEYSGGTSKISWLDEEQGVWKCELGKPTPRYCSYIIRLRDDNDHGVDLSGFESMELRGKYEGVVETVRIYLRNRNDAYFDADNNMTTKYNQIEVLINKFNSGVAISMENFGVADWWLSAQKIPLEHAHPEFNDVLYIEFQTGTRAQPGTHIAEIDRIIWRGTRIDNETIYKGLVLFWSAFILVIFILRLINMSIKLERDRKYQNELQEINKVLDLQNKEFVDLARTDQLTGLLNRIGVRGALFENLKIWKEKHLPFSLVLLDIDNFKRVNDEWGHDVGDQILKDTAKLLAKNTRHTDCLARWGGEEFMLVCHDTDLYRAQMFAEILRKKLEDSRIHPDIKVTASFGVAALSKPDLDDLFKRADQALYEAKTLGRNRVCVNADV